MHKQTPFTGTNTHSAERRLLFFAGEQNGAGGAELNIRNEDLKDLQPKIQEKKDVPLTPEQEKQRVDTLVGDTNATLDKYKQYLKSFSPDLQAKFKTELVKFFGTTVESFDTNKDGLQQDEFNSYKLYLQQKLDAQLQSMGAQVEGVKTEADKKKAEVEQKKKQEALEKKSIEQVIQEATGTKLEKPILEQIDPQQLQDPDHPERMQAELAKHQRNVQKVQEFQKQLSDKTQKIADLHTKSQAEMKLMSDGMSMATAGTWVAAGAVAGSFIPGLGNVIGAGVGLIAAGVAYGIGKGISAEVMKAEKQKKANEYNAILNTQKQELQTAQTQNTEASSTVEAQGTTLNAAPESMRAAQEKLYAERTQQIKDRSTELDTAKVARQQKRTELETMRTQLVSAKGSLVATPVGLDGQVSQTVEQRVAQVETAIASLEKALPNMDPAKRQAAEQRLGMLKSARERMRGVANTNADPKREERIQQLTDKETQITETVALLDQSAGDIDSQAKNLLDTQAELDKGFETQKESLATVDKSIGENVLNANLMLGKGNTDLAEQTKTIMELKPIAPESFTDQLSSGFDSFGHAAQFVFKDIISAGLDKASAWLKENAGFLSLGLPYVLDTVSGISEGAGDLVHGVSTMIGHPIQTAEGLAHLIPGREGSGKAWLEMGKALIAYENFSEGQIGKGTGKVLLNVLLTATGAGAVGKGGQLAGGAFRLARNAGSNVATASTKAALTFVQEGTLQFGRNLSTLPGNLAKVPGKLIAAPGKLMAAPKNIAEYFRTTPLARLESKIAQYSDELAVTTKGVKELSADAAKIHPDLIGKSADELAAIWKDGSLMNQFGLKDPKAMSKFLEYKSAITKQQGLQRALTSTSHTKELVEINEGLNGLREAAANSKPEALNKFVREFNKKNPVDTSNAYRILDTSADGGLVAFDSNGALTRIPKDRVRAFMSEASIDARNVTGSPTLRIPNNADAARLRAAQEVMGELSPKQQQALLRAQKMDIAPRTFMDALEQERFLQARRDVLLEGGFKPDQVDRLLRSHLVSDAKTVEQFMAKQPLARTVLTEEMAVGLNNTKESYFIMNKGGKEVLVKGQVEAVENGVIRVKKPDGTTVELKAGEASLVTDTDAARRLLEAKRVRTTNTAPSPALEARMEEAAKAAKAAERAAERAARKPTMLGDLNLSELPALKPGSFRGQFDYEAAYVLAQENGTYTVLFKRAEGWQVRNGLKLVEKTPGEFARLDAAGKLAAIDEAGISLGRAEKGTKSVKLVKNAEGKFDIKVEVSPSNLPKESLISPRGTVNSRELAALKERLVESNLLLSEESLNSVIGIEREIQSVKKLSASATEAEKILLREHIQDLRQLQEVLHEQATAVSVPTVGERLRGAGTYIKERIVGESLPKIRTRLENSGLLLDNKSLLSLAGVDSEIASLQLARKSGASAKDLESLNAALQDLKAIRKDFERASKPSLRARAKNKARDLGRQLWEDNAGAGASKVEKSATVTRKPIVNPDGTFNAAEYFKVESRLRTSSSLLDVNNLKSVAGINAELDALNSAIRAGGLPPDALKTMTATIEDLKDMRTFLQKNPKGILTTPPKAPVSSLWKRNEVIQGRTLTAVDGTPLPARDYKIVNVDSSNGVVRLQFNNGKTMEYVSVSVEEVNKIPKRTPLKAPTASAWKRNDVIQGRTLTALDGTPLPARDYKVVAVDSANGVVRLQFNNGTTMEYVSVSVEEANKIPKRTFKPSSTSPSGPASSSGAGAGSSTSSPVGPLGA